MAVDLLNSYVSQIRLNLVLATIVLMVAPSISDAKNSSAISQKQKVMAAAIYKFINFVEWTVPNLKQSSLTICLLETDLAFMPLQNRTVHGKPILLKIITADEQTKQCNVIFLNNINDQTRLNKLIKRASSHAVLTISDAPDFLQQGGMIQLSSKNNRLSIGINRSAAQKENISIAFQLLSLADQVIDD